MLIQVPGGPDGPGSFTGFYRDPDGTLRHLAGWEWQAYLAGGNQPNIMSEQQFAGLVAAAPRVQTAGGLDGRFLGDLGAAIQTKVGGGTPAAPTPTMPPAMPSATPAPAPAPTPAPAAPAAPAAADPRDAAEFLAQLNSDFPWLAQIGLAPEWFQEANATASGAAEMLAKIRGTSQYKARFVGLYRKDGSLRMNESQYLQTEATYRGLLRQYGFDVEAYSTPSSLIGFFDSEMDGNELQSRLQTFTEIKASGQATKDAFYVYSGLNISDEDLYSATVDPAARQALVNSYNAAIAGQKFDYQTFITRATEVGNQRVANLLTDMSSTGAVTGAAVQAVLNTDPDFARTIMDALYTGGGLDGATTLNLNELLSTFEEAALGAAASNAGLDLPTKERIAELRTAGVQKAQASEAYMAFGQNKGIYSAATQRAGFGTFGQSQFEDAAFLGDAKAAQALASGMATEAAAGRDQGEFRFREEANRVVQAGLR